MKIAQVAPLYESVPPKFYGGTERVVSHLTEELIRQGHEVTLFASGDSTTRARLVPVVPRALRLDEDCQDSLAHHMRMLDRVAAEVAAFDIVHCHLDYLPFPLLRRLDVPHVTTLHGRLDLPDLRPVFDDFRDMPVVSISDAQRRPLPQANWQATVHHGLPLEPYHFHGAPGSYLCFLGRISPEKQVDHVIKIGLRLGMRVRIAAKIDKQDRSYFEQRIRPLLNDPLVEYVGEIGEADKCELLGNALALLFPINWPEPFGLAMIEAMACGTPVIAYRCGSVPEVVHDGVTGYIVDDMEGALEAVKRIECISREACRRHVEEHFCAERMAGDYLRVYGKLIQRGLQARRLRPAKGTREAIHFQDRWYVLAQPSRADERGRVLKHDDTFGLFDEYGDIQEVGLGDEGLYHQGTRFLSHYDLEINGQPPMLLNSSVKLDNTVLSVDLTAAKLEKEGEVDIPHGALHLLRNKFIHAGVMYESFVFTNYAEHGLDIDVTLRFGCDYADIFEVRGTKRERRGEMQPAKIGGREVVLSYRGLDDVIRRSRIGFSHEPESLSEGSATFRVVLQPLAAEEIQVSVACEVESERPTVLTFAEAAQRRDAGVSQCTGRCAQVTTSNEQFNDWINRSAADLHMLVSATAHGPYPYAGVPWYSTPFGRDGIITALQTLWRDPAVARGTLAYLAATQAEEEDPERDAQPGKILHETRKGELAALNEIPFALYYGSVDATPLFVTLAGAYWRRTGDDAFMEQIWPNVRRALTWIERYGDADGDGFVEYRREGKRGLVQQGWKDSEDSVFHADGVLAEPPIALCEVQGYVYKAKLVAAELERTFGDIREARRLEQEAEFLKRRFNETFWLEDLGTYALALDGDKRPCRVCTTNAGHALFGGIADIDKAQRIAQTLLAPDSFNGWGLRTLSTRECRYNPMSYHNGSVWPHDTSLCAMGFARYGLTAPAMRIMTGLFEASVLMELHRLPELFCGFDALPDRPPTLYPVACSPQAWASGAVFQLLQAVLGMTFAREKPQIRFRYPVLPDYLQEIEIRNLQVGNGVIDLFLRGHQLDVGVNVMRKEGDIEVAVVV